MFLLILVIGVLTVSQYYMWAKILRYEGEMRIMKEVTLKFIKRYYNINSELYKRADQIERTKWSPDIIDNFMAENNPPASTLLPFVGR